jgi:23S rRNA pseudouridine1911/1915/1917 synthase
MAKAAGELWRSDNPAITKIACRLETGRTHQIRVHMAHIGHGVVGDPDYGRGGRTRANRFETCETSDFGLSQTGVAGQNAAIHPSKSGKIVRFEVELDKQLQELEALLTAP